MGFYHPHQVYRGLAGGLRTAGTLWQRRNSSGNGDPRKSIKWVDGLRGIASFLVLLTHLARAWDYSLFSPRDSPESPPRLLQWPILRIPWQGRIGVAIFAFLTGYVCALKPLKLALIGDYNAALTTVAKSAFRRSPRLVLPATIAMVISWVVAQFGGYTVANRSDSWWCRFAAPDVRPTLFEEIVSLFKNFLSTWTTGYMQYDDHQWALLPLLQGSMLVYILLFVTIFCKFRWRLLVYIGMLCYFYQDDAKDVETFQSQCVYGMFLCDLSYSMSFQAFIANYPWTRRAVALCSMITGLLIASYPGENPEWSPWSAYMFDISSYIFPPGVNVGRRYTALGTDLVISAVSISPGIKSFLSNRLFLWLGKHSFSVYLVHGTLFRTVLVWMLYGVGGQSWEEVANENGEMVPVSWLPRRAPWVFAISIPTWIAIVYVSASLWTRYVDTFCARMTQRLEDLMFKESEKPQQSLTLTSVPMQTG